MKLMLYTGNAIEKLRLEAITKPTLYSSTDSKWIVECLGPDSEAVESQIDFEPCELAEDLVDPEKTDSVNAERIHRALKAMSPLQASDERVWASLCHREFWIYATSRWGERNVQQRYFFQGSVRRSIERNAIARLWWFAHLTYDSINDSYECTRHMLDDLGQDFALNLIGRNYSNNTYFNGMLIKILMNDKYANIRRNRLHLRAILKRIHIICGALLIDSLDMNGMSEIIKRSIDEIDESLSLENGMKSARYMLCSHICMMWGR